MIQHKNRFAAREIDFLKSPSDKQSKNITEPENYLSDLLLSGKSRIKSFKQRLTEAHLPHNQFLCAVLKIRSSQNDTVNDTHRLFQETFDTAVGRDGGIWEKIDTNVFAIAFWNYGEQKAANEILDLLKHSGTKTLNCSIIAGAAWYPFSDFSKTEVMDNAVKAVDHAAFFGENALQFADAVTFNITGDRLFNLGLLEEASLEYRKGIELDDTNTNLINSLGVCYGMMSRLDKAEEQFHKTIKLAEEEVMATYNLGLVYNLKNHTEKAVACLKKANSINSSIYEIELLLGTLLFKKKEMKKARYHLKKASDLKPESSTPFKTMGELFLANKQPQNAVNYFNRAIKLNPSDAASMSGLARAYEVQNKNMDIALIFAKKSVSYEPANPLFRTRLAKIYLKRKEHDSAKAEFEKAASAKGKPAKKQKLKKAVK